MKNDLVKQETEQDTKCKLNKIKMKLATVTTIQRRKELTDIYKNYREPSDSHESVKYTSRECIYCSHSGETCTQA